MINNIVNFILPGKWWWINGEEEEEDYTEEGNGKEDGKKTQWEVEDEEMEGGKG